MVNSILNEGYYLTSDNIADYYTWIEVDGEPLQVYGVEEKENKIIGYVEAQEGKQFTINFADLRTCPPENAYSARACVDGEKCGGRLVEATDSLFKRRVTASARFRRFSGRSTSQTTMQPFLFSKLELTDDDDAACTDENALKNLGSISVKYRRVKNVRASKGPGRYSSGTTKKFHEKAKKAQLSHQAAFGAAVTVEAGSRWRFDSIDDEEHPLQTFEFRYRSRQLLQLEGLIPDSPTPSPRPSPSPIPPVVASPPLAQAPASPVASTSATAARLSNERLVTVKQENDRLARLKEELESLDRQERIAALRREIAELEGGGSSPSSSSIRKVKADPDGQRDVKRVKREAGEASPLSQASGSGRGKGKGKEKADVIVLSDSE